MPVVCGNLNYERVKSRTRKIYTAKMGEIKNAKVRAVQLAFTQANGRLVLFFSAFFLKIGSSEVVKSHQEYDSENPNHPCKTGVCLVILRA